jgi:hypothetical protein
MVEPKRRLRNSRISETPGGLIGSSPLYRTTTESTPAGGTAPARLPLRGRPIWHSGARMTSPPTTPVLLGPGLADGEAQWDWWNHWSMQGTKRRWAPRIPQRDHENPALQPPAVLALILSMRSSRTSWGASGTVSTAPRRARGCRPSEAGIASTSDATPGALRFGVLVAVVFCAGTAGVFQSEVCRPVRAPIEWIDGLVGW